jgi:hypothetical protein
VRKSTFILFLVILLAAVCRGEARWCDITGDGGNDKVLYPPIARAAHVSGTVLARITYTPQGDIKEVISISGPPLLAKFTAAQIRDWHMKTNAVGGDLCQSLAIVQFRLSDNLALQVQHEQLVSGSIMRLFIDAQMPPCLCDPEPTLAKKRRSFFSKLIKPVESPPPPAPQPEAQTGRSPPPAPDLPPHP